MYEKILAKLTAARGKTTNISDQTLKDTATSFASVISTDEQLEAFDATRYVETVNGNINSKIAEAVKTQEPAKNADPTPEPTKNVDPKTEKPVHKTENNEPPEWAKALIDQNKALADKLNGYEADKAKTSRLDMLKKSISDAPDFFQKPFLGSFEKTNFADDNEFNEYLAGVKASKEDFFQTAKEQNLNQFVPSKDVKKPKEDGTTPLLSDALKDVKEAAKN